MLVLERLRSDFNYSPETGEFVRINAHRNCPKNLLGAVAGTINAAGYVQISIDGKRYLAHRLAWLFVYSKMPAWQIDHINGNKDDNRITNLRQATGSENLYNRGKPRNNTSGFKGVSWISRRAKWQATIRVGRRNRNLGYFDCVEQASAAYNKAALKHHGEFARLDL